MGHTVPPRILVAVFGLLAFIVVSNNTAAAIAQPAIGRAFDAGPADVGWVVFGFGTTFAIATALWGGLAARLGVGSSLAAGVLLFSGGSALAAFAPSLPVLIGARAVQGFGAGAIPTLSATAIALQFDGPARSRAIGTVIAGVVVGIALGPLLGGVAEQLVGWQGPVAFGVVALPAAALLYRHDDRSREPSARFDRVGAILVAVAAAAMTFSLNRLPVLGLSLPTATSFAIVALAIAAIVRRWDRAGAFVPRRIVADRAFTSIVALGALGMGAFLGTLVLIPVAAARVHGLAGLALGLPVLPLAIVAAVASVRNASVQEWLGRRRTTTVSLAALSLGAAGCGLVGAEADPILTAVALIPLGLGFGLLQAPLVNEVTVSFGGAARPVALGLYNLVYFLGGAVGAAISTGFVQGTIELPILADRALPGFSTSLLILAVGPALAAAIPLLRSRAGSDAGFRRARPEEAGPA